jgi:4'-phosphopantetheinyl transferase
MVYIFTAYSGAYSLSEIIRCYEESLPDLYIKKARSYMFEKDACNFLLGKVLLLKGMRKLGYLNIDLNDMRFNEFSKPYFNNGFSFNISHSGHYVVCALSKTCNLGIDLEEIKSIQFEHFINCFSETEWLYLINAANPLTVFYKFWTKKEAVIKADGKGLGIPLSSVGVIDNRVLINSCNWFLTELHIAAGYIAHIATDTVCNNYIIELLT